MRSRLSLNLLRCLDPVADDTVGMGAIGLAVMACTQDAKAGHLALSSPRSVDWRCWCVDGNY